jgi:hypothetical protein
MFRVRKDIRIAVFAAVKTPSGTLLPSGHPKFIVFRRDAATNVAERAEARRFVPSPRSRANLRRGRWQTMAIAG